MPKIQKLILKSVVRMIGVMVIVYFDIARQLNPNGKNRAKYQIDEDIIFAQDSDSDYF